ncbi:MAG TPA: ParB N-terminal domain-containing protein [Aggregicoccus sp.]|nr:ParB N-terminal domain-containing protein [Aggregicoccus sp.]
MELELHQVDLRYAGLRRRDAKRERQLAASLSEVGQLTPVVVVREASGTHVLVDGYKRVRALQRLHRDVVASVAWELPELEALLLARQMRASEGETALEQGWLMRELKARFGLGCAELARRFDKSESWVSRRLALVGELPDSVQELVRQGQLPAHAAMKHLVPLARAKRAGWEALPPVLAAHRLSSRDVGALVAAWTVATAEGKRLILADPLLVLRAEEEAKRPKEKSAAERLLSDVAALGGIARRARHLADEERIRGASGVGTAGLQRAAQGARAETEALFSVLLGEVAHAG